MKSVVIEPYREPNGKAVVNYGFTYSELRDLDEAIYELISYQEDMLSRDDSFREKVLGRLNQLAMKIDMYRGTALLNLEEE
jgi:hypothetical protein